MIFLNAWSKNKIKKTQTIFLNSSVVVQENFQCYVGENVVVLVVAFFVGNVLKEQWRVRFFIFGAIFEISTKNSFLSTVIIDGRPKTVSVCDKCFTKAWKQQRRRAKEAKLLNDAKNWKRKTWNFFWFILLWFQFSFCIQWFGFDPL